MTPGAPAPYQPAPYQPAPYQQGPYPQGPYPQGPYQQGPYQQGPNRQAPNWGPAPAPAAPPRRSLPVLADAAPQVVAALAISAGVVVLFLADFLIALGQPVGTPGNERMVQFLAPANLVVAAILVVAVALVSLFPAKEGPSSAPLAATSVRALAGFVAAAVAVAAFLRAIVVLTIAHERAAFKLGSMVDALAALVVATAAAYWALKPRLQR